MKYKNMDFTCKLCKMTETDEKIRYSNVKKRCTSLNLRVFYIRMAVEKVA